MFEKLNIIEKDAILGIMTLFNADPSSKKVNLSIGVYQDETGNTPVMSSVRKAEAKLITNQLTKAYVGIAGQVKFNQEMERLVFGPDHDVIKSNRVATVQTPGGSGGLSVAAHVINRAKAGSTVWASDPTWPNHIPLLSTAGLVIQTYPYYDRANHGIKFNDMLNQLSEAKKDDVLLLHGCCHNPCGADLDPSQWNQVADLCLERDLVPLVDLAYLGLGDSLEEDAIGVRILADKLPELMVVISCSKNLGLYKERVGAILIVSSNSSDKEKAFSNLTSVARSIYSMPPDHGAAIALEVLTDPALREEWKKELNEVRDRIKNVRHLLASKLNINQKNINFSFIENEKGMFSFLGLKKEQVILLREKFNIYMVESSRINIAGINASNLDYLTESIRRVI